MRKLLTRRNLLVAGLVLLVVLWWWRGKQAEVQKTASLQRVVTVSRGQVELSLQVSGEVKADSRATLNYPASGKVAYMGVKEGDVVKKGQLLAYLDPGDLQAAERKAYYTYLAADTYAKLIEDQVKGHDSDETFTQKNSRVTAQTSRDSAYDTWLTTRRTLQNSQLVAPFSGVVTSVTATAVGDTASIADGISLVDPTSLYFSAEVDESDVGKVTESQKVEVSLDAFPKQKFEVNIGEVGFVSGISSTGATIYPVKLVFKKEDMPRLRLGMNGDAKIVLAVKENVLKLPVEAVVEGQVNPEGKDAKKVPVQVGLEGDTEVEIVSGLNEGAKVILK